jgi:hypothetical protein
LTWLRIVMLFVAYFSVPDRWRMDILEPFENTGIELAINQLSLNRRLETCSWRVYASSSVVETKVCPAKELKEPYSLYSKAISKIQASFFLLFLYTVYFWQ